MRGRRLCGPRRVPLVTVIGDVESPLTIADEAIDLGKSDVLGFHESNFSDLSKITFKPGEQPSWFTIVPMTPAQIRATPSNVTALVAAEWRIRCGLIKIENFPIISDDGSETQAPQPDRKARGSIGECASEEWIDSSGLTVEDKLGLAAMIQSLSEAKPPFARCSGKPSGPGTSDEHQAEM